MSDAIYLRSEDGHLIEMLERDYDSEAVLQELLRDHPHLLAGGQVSPGSPRRWLHLMREMPVPDSAASLRRWSLDHLFVDQDGVPTLVEVKRASDTRLRREVVGQMLDYAANGSLYWPIDETRRLFEAACEARGVDPDEYVSEILGDDVDSENLWTDVESNLRAGRLRIIFVADEIPRELQSIVEFLNAQMHLTEVLAVAVKQYAGGGLSTLVPRLVGQTAQTQRKSAGALADRRDWDEPTFLRFLSEHRGEAEAGVARALIDWSRRQGLDLDWSKNTVRGILRARHVSEAGAVQVFSVWTQRCSANLYVGPVLLKEHPGLSSASSRSDLVERLRRIPDVTARGRDIDGFVSIGLEELHDGQALQCFLEVIDWVIAQLDSHSSERASVSSP